MNHKVVVGMVLFLACTSSNAAPNKRRKPPSASGSKLPMVDKKTLQALAGVKKDRKITPVSCGVVVQLIHPIRSSNVDIQKERTVQNNKLANSLVAVKKTLGVGALVAFKKITYSDHKLFFNQHSIGIIESDYPATMVRQSRKFFMQHMAFSARCGSHFKRRWHFTAKTRSPRS
jgi:hypothetical protein